MTTPTCKEGWESGLLAGCNVLLKIRLFFFFLINDLFIYFWLRWVFVAVCGLLTVVTSHVVEHGL